MNVLLTLADFKIRDPFILPDPATQTYYLYASDYKTGVMAYRSKDLRHWSEPAPVFRRPDSFWGGHAIWAPEVHKLGAHYYLFVTFDRPDGRSTAIFRAEKPDGPFVVFSDEAVTAPEEQCLDGTPWVDASGQNWMIYCEEWLRVHDGAMRAVRMAPDWSRREGESVLLFHASQAPWVKPIDDRGNYVTDGPYLHHRPGQPLVMTWSSFCWPNGSYSLAVAHSESGKVEGTWTHAEKPIYNNDGGHGMIFRDFDGRLLLVLHSPNKPVEHAHIFEIDDTHGVSIVREVT